MKIELKNIKYSAFASEETNCYEASLHVDGIKIGIVKNDGHGGPDYFNGDDAKWDAANLWCKENLPKWDMADYGDYDKRDTDLEMYCGEAVDAWLLKKDFQKALRRAVLLLDTDGHVYEVPFRKNDRVKLIEAVKARYSKAKILNDMPQEKALEIYAST